MVVPTHLILTKSINLLVTEQAEKSVYMVSSCTVMDKSCVAGLCGAVDAHMVLVAVFLFLGQHLRLEDIILEDSILD